MRKADNVITIQADARIQGTEPRHPLSRRHLSMRRHPRIARSKIPTYEDHQHRCVADIELAVENEMEEALALTRPWLRRPRIASQQ